MTRIFDLRDGLADIAIGNLTVTPERMSVVDFVAPDDKLVNIEILVTGPASPPIASLDELAGKTVHVRKASSYHGSLMALNERFEKEGKAPVNLVLVPDALEDEDMLEMMNAGLLEAMVVDDWKAKMWAPVLPRVKVNESIVLRPATRKGWAVRKNSPKLVAALNDIYTSSAKKAGVIPYRQRQYMKAIKALNNPAGSADYQRFQETIALFDHVEHLLRLDVSPYLPARARAGHRRGVPEHLQGVPAATEGGELQPRPGDREDDGGVERRLDRRA